MHSPHHQSEPLLQQAHNQVCQHCFPHYQVPLKDSVDSAPVPKEVDHSPSAPKYSELPQYDPASTHSHTPASTHSHTPSLSPHHTPTTARKRKVSYHSSTNSIDQAHQQQHTCQCPGYSTPVPPHCNALPVKSSLASHHSVTRSDTHRSQASSPASVVLSQQQTKAINSIYASLQARQAQLSKINQALNKPLPITACADKICTSANKTTNAVNSLNNRITNQHLKTKETVDYCTCLSVCILLVVMFMIYMILHALKVV